jgi:putative nucleotidyltransferase with HDIG domain
MRTRELTTRLFWIAEGIVLAAAVLASAWISHTDEWHPIGLVAVLLTLCLLGRQFNFSIRGQDLSAAFIPVVLAMSLLGPAPAVAIALTGEVLSAALARLAPSLWLTNLSTHSAFPLAGGLMVLAVIGDPHDPRNQLLIKSVSFALLVFAVFMVTNALNFAMIAVHNQIVEGRRLSAQVRDLFVPMLPGQIATGALAAIFAVAYTNLGLPILLGLVLVLLIFQYLVVALLRSEDRADQLEARSIQLASLQFGVLATLMNALALRDRTTARHATAVARYAKALAKEAGCDETEQEAIHTAGLLHDIGKFTWSDRVLHPEQLTDEDWEVIRRHPQDGATLVGKLDGYGPVADAILYHHERIDGGGYPAGLIGNEIPLASRIVAVCSTYDRMTARETYLTPMKPEDAMAELRKVAGHQLDGELVELFIALIEREGSAIAGEDADFESELAFERRVRSMAQPSAG